MEFSYLIPQVVPLTCPKRSRTIAFFHAAFIRKALRPEVLNGGPGQLTVQAKFILSRKGNNTERELPLTLVARESQVEPAFFSFDLNCLFADCGLEAIEDNETFVTIEFSGPGLFATIQPSGGIWSHHLFDDQTVMFTPTTEKYSMKRTIVLMQGLRRYIEYHAAICVSKRRNLGASALLLNPYPGKIRYEVKVAGGSASFSKVIPPFTAHQVSLPEVFPDLEEADPTTVMIESRHKLCMYIMTHTYDDKCKAVSIDHLDQYRSYPLYLPWSQLVRRRLGHLLRR